MPRRRVPVGAAAAWLSELLPGDSVLLWYSDDDVFHERCLCWPLGGDLWVVTTPDGDTYAEHLSGTDPTALPSAWRWSPADVCRIPGGRWAPIASGVGLPGHSCGS